MTSVLPRHRRIGCHPSGAPLKGEVDEQRRFHLCFQAQDDDIDELGHVNNAVWIVWIQDASVAHWFAMASPGDVDRYVSVVLRHQVDYRGNIAAGETVTAVTWVEDSLRGARYRRRIDFIDVKGRVVVAGLSEWAMIDRCTHSLFASCLTWRRRSFSRTTETGIRRWAKSRRWS